MKKKNNFVLVYGLSLLFTLCVAASAYMAYMLGVLFTIMGLCMVLFGFFATKLCERIGGLSDEI